MRVTQWISSDKTRFSRRHNPSAWAVRSAHIIATTVICTVYTGPFDQMDAAKLEAKWPPDRRTTIEASEFGIYKEPSDGKRLRGTDRATGCLLVLSLIAAAAVVVSNNYYYKILDISLYSMSRYYKYNIKRMRHNDIIILSTPEFKTLNYYAYQ